MSGCHNPYNCNCKRQHEGMPLPLPSNYSPVERETDIEKLLKMINQQAEYIKELRDAISVLDRRIDSLPLKADYINQATAIKSLWEANAAVHERIEVVRTSIWEEVSNRQKLGRVVLEKLIKLEKRWKHD